LRVSSLTRALPLKTRETVAVEAPDNRLTSYSVGRLFRTWVEAVAWLI
jgi:hypothetical protein